MRSYSLNLKILACFVIFLAVIALSCKPKSPKETDADKSSTAPAEPGPDIAVTVNGVDILESEIEKLVKPQLEMIAKQSTQLPPTFAEQYAKQLREKFIEQTIRRNLLDEKVKQANIVITDEEVMSMIEEIATSQKEPLTIEEFKKKLAEYGQSFDEVKMEIREGLARNKFMQPYWEGKTNITEEEAQKYYNEN
ncbi:MAG TPA: SurA N-terminal domain-containing protein, partial [Sedimentisphaerales bacterium]|nr:SurA N-terminal domain-containing protein [Sedimentisphaerales bacterium]